MAGRSRVGLQKALLPGVRQLVDALQLVIEEQLGGFGVRVQCLDAAAHLVEDGPRLGALFATRHQVPLFVNDLAGVGACEFLNVPPLGFGQTVGQPEDRGKLVGLFGGGGVGRLPTLPHGDHQAQQDGIGDAEDRIDKAGDIVVFATLYRGYEVLHQDQPPDRGHDEQRNQCRAQHYADLDASFRAPPSVNTAPVHNTRV
jgi:hypothetical protein